MDGLQLAYPFLHRDVNKDFVEAIERALTEDTIENALEYICIWEHWKSKERESNDTCFGHCMKIVRARWYAREAGIIPADPPTESGR